MKNSLILCALVMMQAHSELTNLVPSSGKILEFHKKQGCRLEYLSKRQIESEQQKQEAFQDVVNFVLDKASQSERKDILEEVKMIINKK